ncbi:MAG: hypothetical protein V7756_11785 [Halopseudomonas sp.]|uniref:hypothetical protein n=1 Tax=Halopseudomonas sp. TaxID=2901191 RepID=UPI003002864C
MKGFAFCALLLLAVGSAQSIQARSLAHEVTLPPVQGWQITATRKVSSVSCAARRRDTEGQRLYLSARVIADREATWELQVTTRLRALLDVAQATASVLVEDTPVATGQVLALGESTGSQGAGRYVRYEFAELAGGVVAIKPASAVELAAPGLAPLQIGSLAPIVTALEQCQRDSLNPAFWNKAVTLCN